MSGACARPAHGMGTRLATQEDGGMARGGKRRRRGAEARANADLGAHIASLGLSTMAEYQAWRRKHGISGGLNTSWQERREERKLAAKDVVAADADAQLMAHVEALGLPSVEAYGQWCVDRGFGAGLNKSRAQRKGELQAAENLRADAALLNTRRMTNKPKHTIRRIHEGVFTRDEMPTPLLARIHDAFTATDGTPGARDALYTLLRQVENRSDLLSLEAVAPQYGDEAGNTYIDAVLALALRRDAWRRDATDWSPSSHNSRRQFGSLARHLLTSYDVPAFMDTAWFQGLTADARLRQDWFVAIGTGTNIRKVGGVPIELTKKMAHLLMQAPRTFTVDQALRWTQVVGMGGSDALAEAIMSTRLGGSFENEEFWVSVVKFLVYSPMLDPSYAEPVVSYIHQQKYEPEQTVGEDGEIAYGDPPHPGFSMRTRKVDALLAEVDEWRGEQAREERVGSESWAPSGIEPHEEEDTDEYGRTRWTIRELTTMRALNLEGKAMRHCVGTYARSCRAGSKSVWSLEATNDEGTSRRVMTISVKTTSRIVTQARGKSNAHPLGGHRSEWHRTRLREGYKVLRRWAADAEITVPKHI